MVTDQILSVLAFLGVALTGLAVGVRFGRRRALAQHRCPPQFTTEQIFALQEREWANRGQKRYDIVNVHAPGRHRSPDGDIARQQRAGGAR